MNCDPIIVGGIEVPCDSPIFLATLGAHILFGLACVVTGTVAMLSKKSPGRHPRFGTIYYWCLSVVFISACVLSAMRWAEDYHLFILGTLSFAAASLGRTWRRRRWRGWVRPHISGMGLSYILLLTAFYVDNGKNLPLWKNLPPIAFWLLPGAVGVPIIIYTLLRHPLTRPSKGSTSDLLSSSDSQSTKVLKSTGRP
jgi:hypothetical protein